jgi:hypothetical protein
MAQQSHIPFRQKARPSPVGPSQKVLKFVLGQSCLLENLLKHWAGQIAGMNRHNSSLLCDWMPQNHMTASLAIHLETGPLQRC